MAIDFALDLQHYWRRKGKEDYLLEMERSPIKDVEIKHLLKQALKMIFIIEFFIRKGLIIVIITKDIQFIKLKNYSNSHETYLLMATTINIILYFYYYTS